MHARAFSWKIALLLVLVVGLLVAGLSAFAQSQGWGMQILSGGATTTPATTTSVVMGGGTSYDKPSLPQRLIIPAIGVDAHVQSVGYWWKDPTEMGIPTNFTDVAWFNEGPRPGEPGSAVIDGHLDGKEVEKAVFYDLDKLKPGDMVEVVDSAGKSLQFKVVETKLYDSDAATADIFDNDPSKIRLNLITCGGDWLVDEHAYTKRVVVFTELVR